MSAHCDDCGADLVFGVGENWQIMTCQRCDLFAALESVREPLHLAYGYFVALVNHGGETAVAAKKGRDHLREAVKRLNAAVGDGGARPASATANAERSPQEPNPETGGVWCVSRERAARK